MKTEDKKQEENKREFTEIVIKLRRVTKVVKGGRRFSFAALVIVGNHKGKIGFGLGKANDVSESIRKGSEKAKANMIFAPIKNQRTVPHELNIKYKSSKILMLPATPGTGIIAGGALRPILELAGYHDVMCKIFGSRNAINVVRAAFKCFSELETPKEISERRNLSLDKLWN